MKRFALLLVFAAVTNCLIASDPPALSLSKEERLLVSLSRAHLESPKVARMLRSGLTTSFLITLKARSQSGARLDQQSGARVDVRYEPWDDVFFATVIHFDGASQRLTLADQKALAEFFGGGNIRLGSLEGLSHSGWVFAVTLRVLPFSESEQQEAQIWFSEKLGETTDRKDPNKVLDMLMATSIKRRSVIKVQWRLEIDL